MRAVDCFYHRGSDWYYPLCDCQCTSEIESAGIIESRSLGMKGTYLKVLIPDIFEEIKKEITNDQSLDFN